MALLAAHGGSTEALLATITAFIEQQAAAADAPEAVDVDQMTQLPTTVAKSADKAMAKAVAARAAQAEAAAGGEGSGVDVGTLCKHSGCDNKYAAEASMGAACVHHPGVPVFHEGLKYWSCCPAKKMTEFADFMSYAGCTTGGCEFATQEEIAATPKPCRYDFYQYGDCLAISIYAKVADPMRCTFAASGKQLKVMVTFGFSNKFELDVQLEHAIRPQESKVEFMAPKIEIVLKKASGDTWAELGKVAEKSSLC